MSIRELISRLTQMHDSIGKSKFSYLLQQAESYLVLNVVARQFHEKYPLAPIFTIHDAIYTFPEYLPDLRTLIEDNFYDIMGINVGLKKKLEKPNPEPKLGDTGKEWAKIKQINPTSSVC